MKGYQLMGFFLVQAATNSSHHCATSVGTPEWLSISKSTNDTTLDIVTGLPPPEDSPDEDAIDPLKPNLVCTPDATKTKAHK